MTAHAPSDKPVTVAAPELKLRGKISVPGDKSITHRAILFGGIAEGKTVFRTSILGRDNFASLRLMRQLGATVSGSVSAALRNIADEEGFEDLSTADGPLCEISVLGRGEAGLSAPSAELDCGNSGTTARLMTGILASQNFSATLIGDHSLSSRPFKRVTEPLSKMGASFSGEKLPLTVSGARAAGRAVTAINHVSSKASAQVKSAILLAGLQADGVTTVTEPHLSRDHTERMFGAMGVPVQTKTIAGGIEIRLPERAVRGRLHGIEVDIPGDFSAAGFFLVAGSVTPNSEIVLSGVGINPARIGLMTILRRMGASIEVSNQRLVGGEEVAELIVRSTELHGIEVTPEEVVLAIDEIPILGVASAFARGQTVITGAEELRVKESDRLAMTAKILGSFGVVVEELQDGLKITGRPELAGSGRESFAAGIESNWAGSGDHRIAMSGAVMQFAVAGRFDLYDLGAVETSFPGFIQCFQELTK